MTYISITTIGFYLLATFKLGKNMLGMDTDGQRPSRTWFYLFGFTALLLHSVVLYQNIESGVGINLGFYNALSLVGWTVVLILMLATLSKPLENLALIIFPLVIIALVLEVILPSNRMFPLDAPFGLRLHVILSICAYSFMTIAVFQALLLALQNRQIQNKHPSIIMRLPPMQLMEELLIQIIAIGFFILSLSIVTGLIFVHDFFGQHLIHKTFFTLVAWLIYGILLVGRWVRGWRSRQIIRWTIGGFCSLLLAYFGSKMVLELILNRV